MERWKNNMDKPVYDFAEKILAYLPHLFAGIILIGIGWFLGWILKRIIVQICVILRVERFLLRFRWGGDLSKADVRYGLFNFIGGIVSFIIFLIFLNTALSVMQLTVLSDLLGKGILFFPRIIVALIIFGIGWFISRRVDAAVQSALLKEAVPRATLIVRFTKTMLLLFFSAMALAELDIAREIVIIGFTVIFITLGVLAIILTALSGRALANKLLDTLDEE